jgi:hypothetical protein
MDDIEIEYLTEEEHDPVPTQLGPSLVELISDFITRLRVQVDERSLPLFNRPGWSGQLLEQLLDQDS